MIKEIEELYKERAYAYDDKIHSKDKGWNEAIQHYDNIGKLLNDIELKLHRLDSIDNANPSEALKYWEIMQSRIACYISTVEHYIIQQALLKAQEPKQYLKWEDLEKFKDKDSVKVKMNDTELSLIIQIDCLNDIYVQLYKEKEDGNCVNLLSDFFRNKELFNDLRLELLE